jgi:acetyltransferase-like isoleucine patch superfamily enzyme
MDLWEYLMDNVNINQQPHAVIWVKLLRSILNKKRLLFLKILAKSQKKALFIGSDSYVGSDCNFRSAGEVYIGDNVGIASQIVVETNLYIEQGTLVSSRVAFIGNDHSSTPGQSSKLKPNSKSIIRIGANCWIGYGTILIGSVTVCSNVIIGAGSIVTRSITESGVYVGVPARKIR